MNTLVEEFCHLPNGSSNSSPVDSSSSSSGEFSVPKHGSSSSDDETFTFEENDDSDAVFKFISDMLMQEEDLVKKPCMLNDCLALQATEKSLFDVLNNNNNNNNLDQNPDIPIAHFTKTCSINNSNGSSNFESLLIPSSQLLYPSSFPTFHSDLQSFGSSLDPFRFSNFNSSGVSIDEITRFLFNDDDHNSQVPNRNTAEYSQKFKNNESDHSPNSLREKKNRYREDTDSVEQHRSNKHLANNIVESEPLDMYDKVLLCSNPVHLSNLKKKPQQNDQSKGSNRGRPRGGKKQSIIIKEVVDLRSLLMQCAQAMSSYDTATVHDLLMRIRRHSSPQGDGTERLAHYFANALEARLAGNGTGAYYTSTSKSAAEILKAYKTFIEASPFRKMSNMLANQTIKKLANGATTLHIIDFGILYGFQWPCLIEALSKRPGGPPKLRITGIDFPQPGFRPAERVEDTGRRLAKYCERFGVPFEYIAIAQKWETIKVEDVKIGENELVVVNSVHRLHNVLDETVLVDSPRDAVLNLIKKINPDMFIHGVLNATYNTPFFLTRFREALFHFSSLFDMFEATVPREDKNRVLFEEEIYGKDAMNIIACEGTQRIDRPETYKQWQARNGRAGFRQMALDQELVKYVRSVVKMDYHKDFSVDEDGKWMLHGWKGRVIYAISYWKPAHK
ncbi:hypothetical protein BUALT_Bualt02G0065700 [Buddleja alternifolia]|uniref:Uncharacterized protein n=1 Tax=Buddleja alternifolia TaxID=168488 RepID=A0AAV6Y8V0_9LAMI|nr:hypothetical protein BUALT_Bualt02G0065700 [Buddleja alternifolia]